MSTADRKTIAHIESGVCAFDSREYARALGEFRRGCEVNAAAAARAALSSAAPPSIELNRALWQNRAAALMELRRYSDAGRCAAQAQALNPSSGATCILGARAALHQGMVGPAVELFAKALELSCGPVADSSSLAAFSRPRWSREDVARLGYTGLKECDRLQRFCAAAKHNIGAGEPALALEDAVVALRLAQVSPRVIRLVVEALAGCGRVQEAVDLCEAALPLQWIPTARQKNALLKAAQMGRTARAAAAIRTAKKRVAEEAATAAAGAAERSETTSEGSSVPSPAGGPGGGGADDDGDDDALAQMAKWHQVRLVLVFNKGRSIRAKKMATTTMKMKTTKGSTTTATFPVDRSGVNSAAASSMPVMPMMVYTHLESLGLLYARLLRRSSLDGCALAIAVLECILGTAESPSAEHEHFHQARLEQRTVRRVATLVERAKSHLTVSEWEQARRLTNIAIAAVGNVPSVEMSWQRALVAEQDGRMSAALDDLREAIEIALPDDGTLHALDRALARLERGDDVGSVSSLDLSPPTSPVFDDAPGGGEAKKKRKEKSFVDDLDFSPGGAPATPNASFPSQVDVRGAAAAAASRARSALSREGTQPQPEPEQQQFKQKQKQEKLKQKQMTRPSPPALSRMNDRHVVAKAELLARARARVDARMSMRAHAAELGVPRSHARKAESKAAVIADAKAKVIAKEVLKANVAKRAREMLDTIKARIEKTAQSRSREVSECSSVCTSHG